MSKTPIGSTPSQASATQISTWIGYCSDSSEHHFANWIVKWKFRIIKRLPKRGILKRGFLLKRGILLIQICSFRKAKCSVVDWSYRPDKAICTVWNRLNPLEFSDVIKMWILCCTRSREIQNLLLIFVRNWGFGAVHLSRETSLLTRRSENTNPREKMARFSRDIRNAKGSILLTRAGGPPSKSASQSRAADQLWLGPSFNKF